MVRQMVAAGVLMGLVGCSSPPQAPQEISDVQYAIMVRNEGWLESCTAAGMLSSEIAGEGALLAQQDRQLVVYSPVKLEALKKQARPNQVATQAACTTLGAQIHAHYLNRVGSGKTTNTAPQQNPYGRTTNCSTVYGWTNCYSY